MSERTLAHNPIFGIFPVINGRAKKTNSRISKALTDSAKKVTAWPDRQPDLMKPKGL